MLSIGIIGLPNVGKSTLFKALTKKQVAISNYPFCTIEPNHGVVAVPDERLEKLAAIVHPQKITSTAIEFVDIAGLVKKAHLGEGLGNQFLAQIREVDAILEVVRCFQDPKITHVEGTADPTRDIETIKIELIMKDLETVRKRLEKTKTEAKSGDKEKIKEVMILEQIKNRLDQGEFPDDSEGLAVKELQLLSAKPVIYVFNVSDEQTGALPGVLPPYHGTGQALGRDINSELQPSIKLDFKLEEELSELTPQEIQELGLSNSGLDQLIKLCYDVLTLVTFFTMAGGKELRAWTIKKDTPVVQAAGKIHKDFEQKFIKAEVIDWQKLIEAGFWNNSREKGWLRTEGKEYLVQDGDVVEIKI